MTSKGIKKHYGRIKKLASVIGNLLATDPAFGRGLDVLHFVVASLIDVWIW